MVLDKYSIEGKVVGQVDLSDDVFGQEVNDVLVYEFMKAANANLRQGTHATKGRAQVRGGGAKPWRQKGTGRARAGTLRSPIFVGGGTVFGPKPRSYRIDLPKKLKQAAYRSIFSLKVKAGSVMVVEDFAVAGKTKEAAGIASKLDFAKGLLLVNGDDALLKRAFKNIPFLKLNSTERLSGRDIFYAKKLVITESALKSINEKYSKGDQ